MNIRPPRSLEILSPQEFFPCILIWPQSQIPRYWVQKFLSWAWTAALLDMTDTFLLFQAWHSYLWFSWLSVLLLASVHAELGIKACLRYWVPCLCSSAKGMAFLLDWLPPEFCQDMIEKALALSGITLVSSGHQLCMMTCGKVVERHSLFC